MFVCLFVCLFVWVWATQTEMGKAYLNCSASTTESLSAPEAHAFRLVWDAMCQGTAPKQGVDGVGKAIKVRKMRWLISEAIKTLDRQFARNAVCLSLRRDASNGRLLLIFTAVNEKLETRTGLFAQPRIESTPQM